MLAFEDVFTHQNILKTANLVAKKDGAVGVDYMTAQETKAFFKRRYKREIIIKKLKKAQFTKHDSRIVKIPKGDGSYREIKIQTGIDRVVMKCLATSLSQTYNSTFSENIFGFIEGKGTHSAVLKMEQHYREGYCYALKVDLQSYFDLIPHNRLINLLKELVDEPLLKVVKYFIYNGEHKGIPQGSALSPFLANLFLTDFDHFMDGLCNQADIRYIRYADDILILSKEDVPKALFETIKARIESYQIKVNEDKTQICKADNIVFLGFSVCEKGLLVSQKSGDCIRERIKMFFENKRYEEGLNHFAHWKGYYGIAVNVNDIETDILSQYRAVLGEKNNFQGG